MSHLIIKKKNEVYITIELNHTFITNYPITLLSMFQGKVHAQYRNKYWDGKIRLFDSRKNELYVGLIDKVISFCNRQGYTYEFEGNKFYGLPIEENV